VWQAARAPSFDDRRHMTDFRSIPFAPEEPRLLVASDELSKAMLVCLRVMPKRIWREVEAYELKKATKRFSREDDPDVYRHVVAYLTDKLEAARWEVVRPMPTSPASP
jgi:hypothetical protein